MNCFNSAGRSEAPLSGRDSTLPTITRAPRSLRRYVHAHSAITWRVWPSTSGSQAAAYDKATGIVTVTMNMNFSEFKDAYDKTAKTCCLPESFCSWTGDDTEAQGGKCSCNTKPTTPINS